MPCWEYMVLSMPSTNLEQLEKRLNGMGSEKWEIIAVLHSPAHHTIYFKRPKRF